MATTLTHDEAIKALSKMVAALTEAHIAEATGACVYTAGTGTYCAVLTKANCANLSGTWTENGKCP